MFNVLEVMGRNDGLSKQASRLAERQRDLVDAPHSDFAVVIYDGVEFHPKYPIKTAEDLRLSVEALASSSDRLPDEVVKVAKFHAELRAQELGSSVYGVNALEDAPPNNVVYVGHVDGNAFATKVVSANEKMASNGKFNLQSESHIRMAERHLAVGLGGDTQEEVKIAHAVIDRASALGIDVMEPKVARFDRASVPASFSEHVSYRKEAAPEPLKGYYDELLKEADHAQTKEKVFELAQALELLDKYAGHAPGIGSTPRHRFQDPYELLFPKQESLNLRLDVPQDTVDKIASVLGQEFAQSYAQNQKLATTLLSPTERQLLLLVTENGRNI